MSGTDDHPNPEDRISELKASIGKYLSGAEEPTGEALAEVTRALHSASVPKSVLPHTVIAVSIVEKHFMSTS